MKTIQERCRDSHTGAFVTAETVDALADKLVGIIGTGRRMTKMHRYLGESSGVPGVYAGLVLDYQGMGGDPVHRTPGHGVSVHLTGRSHGIEGIGFSIGHRERETETQMAERHHHPENQWLGERRDICYVQLYGSPGNPTALDQIRVEYWNANGVGSETILVFDDVNPCDEIFWTLTGNKRRTPSFDDYFCIVHNQHHEDPDHAFVWNADPGQRCEHREATLTENLAALAAIAKSREEVTSNG